MISRYDEWWPVYAHPRSSKTSSLWFQTYLKNFSQIGSRCQVGVKIEHSSNQHLDIIVGTCLGPSGLKVGKIANDPWTNEVGWTWTWWTSELSKRFDSTSNTLDASEIRRSPVEVGCLSHYLQGFIHRLGFLNHQPYVEMLWYSQWYSPRWSCLIWCWFFSYTFRCLPKKI